MSGSIVATIAAKSRGETLSSEQIRELVKAIYKHTIDDAQTGAFLMAVKLKGMDYNETKDLTCFMAEFSDQFSWTEYPWRNLVVDKHSTGGVGDKISHILAPIMAACGLKMPMISGRGLGITGGTIDKLEAISGYVPDLPHGTHGQILQDHGFFIVGQTETTVPVDKYLYAIRDISATVDSIPLITASILSKKKIEDLHVLIMDVKFGKGAIFDDVESAEALATSIIATGRAMGLKIIGIVDDMNTPLGSCVGNALEISEVLQALNGDMAPDIAELVYTMGRLLIRAVDAAKSDKEAIKMIQNTIDSGQALEKLKCVLIAQKVPADLAGRLCAQKRGTTVKEYMRMLGHEPSSKGPLTTVELAVKRAGFVTGVDAQRVGEAARTLGAGRFRKEDRLQYETGLELLVRPGQKVVLGQAWVRLWGSHNALEEVRQSLDGDEGVIHIVERDPAPIKPRIVKLMYS